MTQEPIQKPEQIGIIAFDKRGQPVLRLFPGWVENMAKRYQDRKRREAGE